MTTPSVGSSTSGTQAPVATVPTTTTTATTTTSADNTSLSPDAFLQLLVSQLKYQDPSKPVDTSTFMNETATLSQVQTMQALQTSANSTLSAQQAQTATNLVGKNISYLDSTGATVTGVVSAATISGTTPTVTVGTKTVALTSVQQVFAAS